MFCCSTSTTFGRNSQAVCTSVTTNKNCDLYPIKCKGRSEVTIYRENLEKNSQMIALMFAVGAVLPIIDST
jgi:hypothetical protein